VVLGTSAEAQREVQRRQQSYTVGEYTFEKLEKAQELLANGRYGESREVLDRLDSRRGLNAHEIALVHQTYAHIAVAQERYEEAAVHFEKCLAQQALPPVAALELKYNLAQLYLASEQPGKAVEMLEAWFAEAENPSPPAYYLLALAYFQHGKKDLALPPAQRAVDSSDQPHEAWMQLLLSLYLEEKSYAEAAMLLERILVRFPRKRYWVQLAAVYGELGRNDETLAVTELAYTQGFLTQDRELRNLAQLYLYHQIPYSAARVLVRGINEEKIEADAEALELLAESWLSAREYDRAMDPLARAARLSDDGDLYVRLAQLYMEQEEWSEAIGALRAALQTGKLKNRGRTLLLLGISEFSAGSLEAAKNTFERAREHESTRTSVDQWLEHLERRLALMRPQETGGGRRLPGT
jgi:tetratricopeptide (TPR) repeat protein